MPPGTETASPVPAGSLVAGKYRVGEVIARGGMGVIVDARHEALEQRVAIKLLLSDAAQHPELVERFLREARAAARIQSDHVVRVFDVGTHEGVPYMVMELLEGTDLSDVIDERGPLPVSTAVDYVLQALEALAEAHAMGIVHRDLKPGNLFLATRPDRSERIKVLDFGISKIAGAESAVNAALTSTKSMLGSPGYMSPEQVRSTKGVDARTDIWSVGVILYELLVGEHAFRGESLGDIFAKIREEDLPLLRTRRADVPEGLEAVVARCLRRDREQRWPDVAALRDALGPFASARGRMSMESVPEPVPAGPPIRLKIAARAGGAAHAAETVLAGAAAETRAAPGAAGRSGTGSSAGQTNASWSGVQERPTRRPRATIAAVVGVLAVGGASAWWLVRAPEPTPVEPRPEIAAAGSPPPSSAVEVLPAQPSAVEAPAGPPPTAEPSTKEPARAAASVAPAVGRPAAPSRARPAAPVTAAPVAPPPPAATKKKKDDLGI